VPGPDRQPSLLARGAHLAVAWSFAVSQPLFQVLRPEFFFDSLPTDGILFAVGLALIPPAGLLAAEALVALVSRVAAWRLHLVLMAGLAGLFVAQLIANVTGTRSIALVVLAGIAGVAFAAAYRSVGAVRLVVTVLTPAVVLFLGLFVFTSDSSRLMLAGQGAPHLHSPRSRTPVVMLLFDELPATSLLDASGRLDATRYPNFARFARGATWFRNASTVHDSTFQAIPAIMTGRRSELDALPTAADRPDSVFTLLGGSYRIHASETTQTHVCPERLCPRAKLVGFVRRMRTLAREGVRLSLHQWLPDRVANRLLPGYPREVPPAIQAQRFIAGVAPSRAPSLQFLHLLLPHQPWRYLPSGKTYPQPETNPFRAVKGLNYWPRDPGQALDGYQRHLLQLEFADRVLGAVLQSVRRAHLYERAIVVVMADHGISFRPGQGPRVAAPGNAPDIFAPPLLIKLPGQRRGRVSSRFVRTVDVLPTIAAALRIRLPFRVDGQSVFDPHYREPRELRVTNRLGGSIAVSPAALVRGRAAALRRRVLLFGSGSPDRVYWTGANSDLLGRPAGALHAAGAPADRVALDAPGALTAVDLRAPVIPARVSGVVSGPDVHSGTQIVLALNGRVVAATPAYAEGGRLRFGAMVPEHALHNGRNDLSVFAIRARGGRRTLASLHL
jgi:hypothetical protein